MKVAICSSGLGCVSRGIETWAEDLADALSGRAAASGVSVTLFRGGGCAGRTYERVIRCAGRGTVRNSLLTGLCRHCGGWRYGYGSPYQAEQETFARSLIPALRSGGFDIVHLQDPWLALRLQQARTVGRQPARVILAHGTEEAPEFLKKFKYIQHLAPFHLEEARACGVRADLDEAIPNFVDTAKYVPGKNPELRARLKIPDTAFVVLCVAAIKRDHKRVDHLITEVAGSGDPDLYVVIAGARTGETADIKRDAEARLGSRAVFLTDMPRAEMPGLYRIADMFALCSLKEMMPLALLEAMACGIPSLCHRHPVLEWMVGAGGAAIDMSEAGGLARALLGFRNNPEIKLNAAAAARRRVEIMFGKEAVVSKIVEMYRKVMESKYEVGSKK